MASKRPNQQPNTLRIIGGEWRGRKICFNDGPGLRPTQDRIRETLFNWLMHDCRGANCLDLFAGSGALGFEALSRGASHVTFVDSSTDVLQMIEHNGHQLATEQFDIVLGTCPVSVPLLRLAPFDIVFLDAPFYQDLVNPAIKWLVQQRYVKANSLIYFEIEKGGAAPQCPPSWQVARHKQTGSLDYYLYRVEASGLA